MTRIILTLNDRINNLNSLYNEKKETLSGKKMTLKSHEIAISRFVERLDVLANDKVINDKSMIILNKLVDEKNEVVMETIKETINNALNIVPLTNDYKISIEESETKRSGKELNIKLLDTEVSKLRGLRTSSGTAVAQLVSFIMRIVLIGFSESRKILLVDENFSGFQDKETINIFGTVLTTLAEQEGFQIIMVEHKSEFLNVPKIKNVILKKNNYSEGVTVENILDASDYE